ICLWLLLDSQSLGTPLPFTNVSYQLGTYRDFNPARLLPCPTYQQKTGVLNTGFLILNALISY
ncbi:MAG: hypothetical protein U9Q98_02915, partial [Bacteroidota bacterium]|nr:hypothetical protein [Bacteroidota bacterium]